MFYSLISSTYYISLYAFNTEQDWRTIFKIISIINEGCSNNDF
jgi:hypothetical protein